MKKIYLTTLSAILTISFTACGSSSSTPTEVATPTPTPTATPPVVVEAHMEKINIDINCTIPATIDSYIELQKGDKIVKNEHNSTISIYHDENSNKRACLERGVVHIDREES